MSNREDFETKSSIVTLDYPSNSNTSKDEEVEKKVTQVTTGKVTKQKKSFRKKVSESILSDDTDKESVTNYILYDVLIPATKSMLSDMVSGGVEMFLFGSTKSSKMTRSRGVSKVAYNKPYRTSYDREPQRRDISYTNKARHNFDEILIDSRGEAEEVLSHLVELVDQYGVATVADLYDLVGVTSDHVDNKYGWTNLSRASVTRVRGGYLINLPRTQVV